MVHSLEREYRELQAAGLIDEAAAARAIAVERGEIFSVFEEVRFALYASVTAITTGIGILVKENLAHIGPLTLMAALALAAAICYATAIRTLLRQEIRTVGGDYILLLGALILSADLGYAESQFHWLGSNWSWYLLLLAALHAFTAYALDSRLVLAVSLTSLAGWFGVDAHMAGLIQVDKSLRVAAIQALVCAGVILVWRGIHRRAGGPAQYKDVFEHFAANLGFWGAIALCFTPDTRWPGAGILITLAVVSIRKGLRNAQEIFVIYGVVYTALGIYSLESQLISDAVFLVACRLVTMVTAVILLWRLRHRAESVPA